MRATCSEATVIHHIAKLRKSQTLFKLHLKHVRTLLSNYASSGCTDVYIWLNKQANSVLGFGDDSDVLTSCARLMIIMFDVSYANYLAGVRWRVVRINEYQRGRKDTFFFSESVGPSQVYVVYDIHLFYLT